MTVSPVVTIDTGSIIVILQLYNTCSSLYFSLFLERVLQPLACLVAIAWLDHLWFNLLQPWLLLVSLLAFMSLPGYYCTIAQCHMRLDPPPHANHNELENGRNGIFSTSHTTSELISFQLNWHCQQRQHQDRFLEEELEGSVER